jgi:hypothetical protein
MTGTDESIEVPWQWSWVPAPGGDPAAEAQWLAATAAAFDSWLTERGQPPATAANGAGKDSAGQGGAGQGGAGVASGGVGELAGSGLARELCRHAGDLPAGARLVLGVGFDADGPRWWPVQVVVEKVGDPPEDPDYLLDLVGARTVVDGVAPNVTYLSTSFGDCVRVIVAERGPDDRVNALVRAATRIEWPATASGPAMSGDFLLTTRAWDMSLVAVIGPGMDNLMQRMADAIPQDPGAGSPDDRPTEPVES